MTAVPNPIRVMVLSGHDTVRRQLVATLGRSRALVVVGAAPSVLAARAEAERARPNVLVVDLSDLDARGFTAMVALSHDLGARLVALASIAEPAEQQRVQEAGGVYLLKTIGNSQLVDAVLAVEQASAG